MTDTLKFLRIKTIFVHVFLEVSQVALEIKNPPAKVGDVRDLDSTRGSRQSPEAGGGNSLQYSCLGNSMDRKAWQAAVHGVAKS